MEAHAMERVSAEPRVAEARGPRRNWVRPLLMWLGVAAIIIFCLFPFYWLVNVSLKTGSDLSQADLFPPHPSLDNYDSIFKNGDFTSALRNSVIVTSITTVLALVVGSFAAYALARLRFPNKFLLLARDPLDLDLPADRDRGPDLQAVDGSGPLRHLRRPDHPVPHVRAAARDLHPHLLLQGDPEGARGGGARGRRDLFPGVPKGDPAARGAGPRDGRSPDGLLRVERVPARADADQLAEGVHGPGRGGELHRQLRNSRSRSARSPPHPS